MIDWRPVVGHEADYEVSEFGTVRRVTPKQGTQPGRVKKPRPDYKGYLYVGMPGKRMVRIHRMVALAFHPNPNAHELVRHLDGNKLNNHFSNLAWGTTQENADDRVAHGNSRGHWLERTHCRHGHEYVEGSFYLKYNSHLERSYRQCWTCRKAQQARDSAKRKAA